MKYVTCFCCDKDVVMTDSLAQDFYDYSSMLYGFPQAQAAGDKRREFIRGLFIADERSSRFPRNPVDGSKEPILAIVNDRRAPSDTTHPWNMYLVIFCSHGCYQYGKALQTTDVKFYHPRILADFELVFTGVSGLKSALIRGTGVANIAETAIDRTLRSSSPTPEGLAEFDGQTQRTEYVAINIEDLGGDESTPLLGRKKEPTLKPKGVQEIKPFSWCGNFWEGIKSMGCSMGAWCGTRQQYNFKNCTVVLSLSLVATALGALGYFGYKYYEASQHSDSHTTAMPPTTGPGACPPFNISADPSFIPADISAVICSMFQPLIDLCTPFITVWGTCLNLDEMYSIFRFRFPNQSLPFTTMWTEYAHCTYKNPILQQMMINSLTQPWLTNITLAMELMHNETH